MPDNSGKLILWGAEKYQPAQGIVAGVQLFETYDGQGLFLSRRMAEIQFAILDAEAFEGLAAQAGFSVAAMYGEYNYSEYSPTASPYMIYILKHGEVG